MLLDEVTVERVSKDRAEHMPVDVLFSFLRCKQVSSEVAEEPLHLSSGVLDLQLANVLENESSVHLPLLEQAQSHFITGG